MGGITSLWVQKLDTVPGEIVFEEKFNYPDGALPADWRSEGVPASIQNRRLFVGEDTLKPRVATACLDWEFSDNLQVEFDVHVVSSQELANNLNFFFMYADPEGRNFRETKKERKDGNYARYHKLNGYIFTHLANGRESLARFRFRYNPGFTLLEEWNGDECRIGTTYRIKLVKKDQKIQYWTDGKLIIDQELEASRQHKKVIIGFRTYRTSLWWDNLVVRQLD
ncbi:DUF1961 family protein [Cyclobacterium roseum]|uniref:DUF1961 family protein n=1 Tax=Cyclobacterium roseum TaxID=2666137 RepID=UPI001390F34C|nr:DUF1961 family protein [Cyclobacterium roseum]